MEKSTDRFSKYCRRLLILFISLCTLSQAFAKNPTWDELRRLKFSKGQDYFFTATECPFYLNIENVRPENVQVAVNSLPDNVSFVASKKEVLMPYLNDNNEYVSGTKLIVWFRFATPGTYRLRSIDVVINGGYYRLGFESVDVFENPRFILPELKIEFEDEAFSPKGRNKKLISAKTSDHIIFTVYTRYAVRINNCSWDIPENSLFKQVKVYETVENSSSQRKEDFSPEYYPLVTFDWQPLMTGTVKFPSISVFATAYNGSRYELNSPDYSVTITKGASAAGSEKKASSFAYAFAHPSDVFHEETVPESTEKNIQTLAQLHSFERHSLPFSDAVKNRQKFERAMNIPVSDYEPKVPVFIACIVLSVLLITGAVVFLIIRKIPQGSAVLFFGFISLICVFVYVAKLSKKTAVYKGGEIYPIPEVNIQSGADLPAGTVVTVVHFAGDWCYIKHNDTYGWITEDRIILIK